MRGQGFLDAGAETVSLQNLPETHPGELLSPVIQKKVVRWFSDAPDEQIGRNRSRGRVPEGNDPFLASLADTSDKSDLDVDSVQPQANQLGNPQARCVENLQHRAVAKPFTRNGI